MRELLGFTKPMSAMKVKVSPSADRGKTGVQSAALVSRLRPLHSRGVSSSLRGEAHLERTRWDPKDGDLCLARTKSGETLMEVRSDSDVQIDRRSWV